MQASVATECVMLNKRPNVEEAVDVLVDSLRRMEQHHYKKRSIFRRLRVSALDEGPAEPSHVEPSRVVARDTSSLAGVVNST